MSFVGWVKAAGALQINRDVRPAATHPTKTRALAQLSYNGAREQRP
jgi:hypothetical protein